MQGKKDIITVHGQSGSRSAETFPAESGVLHLKAISNGRYLINGFRNKDPGKACFPDIPSEDQASKKC